MSSSVENIHNQLVELLKNHLGPLRITSDKKEKFEVSGTIPAMQGRQKVDGFYFASVVPKTKDVRLYFFPIYTHKVEIGELSENLKKALKGKSCFHIKKIDDEFKSELKNLIDKSIKVYQNHGLLSKD
mgnify:CR=1 FL=1